MPRVCSVAYLDRGGLISDMEDTEHCGGGGGEGGGYRVVGDNQKWYRSQGCTQYARTTSSHSQQRMVVFYPCVHMVDTQ